MIRKSILSDVEQEQARMHGIQSVQTQHTVEAVISGVPGLAAGYPLPEPVNKTVWIFFSSTTEDTVMERDVFVEKCVPERVVDEMDTHHHSILQESAAVNFVTVLGSRYGSRTLPPEIPVSTFNMLLKEIKAMGGECKAGTSTLLRWYKLDENSRPSQRILMPITSEYPDFVNDVDTEKKIQAKQDWEQNVLLPLQNDLKLAALALGEQQKLPNDVVQGFVQSLTHEEIIRGVYNQRIFIDALKNISCEWIPKQNLIVENLPMESQMNNELQTLYLQRITQKLIDGISASILYHADQLQTVDTPNMLVEEILHHSRFLNARSSDFVRREHVVERITSYMAQTKMQHVLPLIISSLADQIAQAYGTSIASPQYQTPFDKFRRALKLPTRLKPLLLVITKLDRLKFEHESEKGFGWLLDDLPGYINIVLSLRDERFPGSHLPQLMSKLLQLSVVAQNELREKKGTIDTSKWTLPVSPEQAVLPIGDFIPTVAKVALKRYIGLDSRRLRPAQEDTIMHAFERASLLDLQRMGTASPLLLRLLYNMS
eukprot:jgi/Hompol1/2295/HPOL_005930-RA